VRPAAWLVLSVLTLSACASNDTDELEPITAQQFRQVEIGMTKDAVRSLLGKPARARTIENRPPITREPGKGFRQRWR
jgi:outer membrane protein assembly factor BamE (lipoprotein component of BamABCDE complex)